MLIGVHINDFRGSHYNFSKHSASDDAGVLVFKVYQDPAPWMQETVNRFATVDLAKAEHFLVCLTR